jgi:hypothetical protein
MQFDFACVRAANGSQYNKECAHPPLAIPAPQAGMRRLALPQVVKLCQHLVKAGASVLVLSPAALHKGAIPAAPAAAAPSAVSGVGSNTFQRMAQGTPYGYTLAGQLQETVQAKLHDGQAKSTRPTAVVLQYMYSATCTSCKLYSEPPWSRCVLVHIVTHKHTIKGLLESCWIRERKAALWLRTLRG